MGDIAGVTSKYLALKTWVRGESGRQQLSFYSVEDGTEVGSGVSLQSLTNSPLQVGENFVAYTVLDGGRIYFRAYEIATGNVLTLVDVLETPGGLGSIALYKGYAFIGGAGTLGVYDLGRRRLVWFERDFIEAPEPGKRPALIASMYVAGSDLIVHPFSSMGEPRKLDLKSFLAELPPDNDPFEPSADVLSGH